MKKIYKKMKLRGLTPTRSSTHFIIGAESAEAESSYQIQPRIDSHSFLRRWIIKFLLLIIIIDGIILGTLYWKNKQINQYTYANSNPPKIPKNPNNPPTSFPLKIFTNNDLMKFNGDNPNLPVYLALDGNVYDVSENRKEYYDPGKSYHDLAGKDSSQILHLFGGDIIKKKYPIIGTYK